MSRTLLTTAVLALAPALAQAAPQTIAVMDVPPQIFVATVASSNAFEIRSSELAAQKATQPTLKEFAAQMIADHRAAAEGLKAAAGDIPVPDALAPKHAAMITLLEGAEGPAFDMIYADMQAGAHAEPVTLFATFSGHGTDAGLKAFAEEDPADAGGTQGPYRRDRGDGVSPGDPAWYPGRDADPSPERIPDARQRLCPQLLAPCERRGRAEFEREARP